MKAISKSRSWIDRRILLASAISQKQWTKKIQMESQHDEMDINNSEEYDRKKSYGMCTESLWDAGAAELAGKS